MVLKSISLLQNYKYLLNIPYNSFFLKIKKNIYKCIPQFLLKHYTKKYGGRRISNNSLHPLVKYMIFLFTSADASSIMLPCLS